MFSFSGSVSDDIRLLKVISPGSFGPVLYAYHELEPGPDFVNGANLDIDKPGVETYLANGVVGKVGSNA
jgi:hypothetical protein